MVKYSKRIPYFFNSLMIVLLKISSHCQSSSSSAQRPKKELDEQGLANYVTAR